MSINETQSALLPRDLKGSRVRCLMLTSSNRAAVAETLTQIAAPYAVVDANDVWMPQGLTNPDEGLIDEADNFLSESIREQLKEWWLVVRRNARTPTWDIASTCTIDGKRGLLLVEAKAHHGELSCMGKPDPTSPNGVLNHDRIGQAVAEASAALNAVHPGFDLSRDRCYQMANRFAWGWRIASLGVPVVLVYLGFLKAEEMPVPLKSAEDWQNAVMAHAEGIVPRDVWGRSLNVGGTPFVPLIRSATSTWRVE